MKQAEDYREEANVLAEVLAPLKDADFQTETLFKGWTINDVIGHLHMFDVAALRTLESTDAFAAFFAPIAAGMQQGKTLLETQYPWLDGLEGEALFAVWHETTGKLANAYATADPKQRVKWAGPDMSALSSITARQMETWAHGHEVFDLLGETRIESDRIKNIVVLGVNTFGWTYHVRKWEVPAAMPYLELNAPSGAVWTFGEDTSGNRIAGSAVGFAQAVTQTRNWADTDLRPEGDVALTWMENAQCFAGGVKQPPAKDTRFIQA